MEASRAGTVPKISVLKRERPVQPLGREQLTQ